MVRSSEPARPSNCGKVLRAFATASAWKHGSAHQGNDLGYGKNAKDWIIRSQVLRIALKSMDAVQRLYGGRSRLKILRLKIESGPPEMGLKDERPNQPRAFEVHFVHGVNRTTGITGLWQPSVHSDVAFWSFDVGSSYHTEAEFGKRWIVHPLIGNVSWV